MTRLQQGRQTVQLPLFDHWRLWVLGPQAASLAELQLDLQALVLELYVRAEELAAHWLIGEECQASQVLTFQLVVRQADNL